MPLVELDSRVPQVTAKQLHGRIGERFPGSGLEQRGAELVTLIETMTERAERIDRPIWWIRALYVLLGLLVFIGLLAIPFSLPSNSRPDGLDWVPFAESAINDVILLGGGIFFVTTIENRIKRGRALRELHELRSFAHVIDMMQLTKDPHRLLGDASQATASSPSESMGSFELGRYLDYCSELLSLSAKGAAVIAQRFDDPPVLAAVNGIEALTSGLSRKIWQKLMILDARTARAVDHANG